MNSVSRSVLHASHTPIGSIIEYYDKDEIISIGTKFINWFLYE